MEPKPIICVSICEKTLAALTRTHATASVEADMVELRLDCVDPPELAGAQDKLAGLVHNSKCPTIVTYRPAEEGGCRQLDHDSRVQFWQTNPPSTFIDVEFALSRDLLPTVEWQRVICSHHDLEHTPVSIQLDELYTLMAATPARILKLAVKANDVIDCLPVFELLDRARKDNREVIAMAMGNAGIATRILGPSRGSFLTYAAPNDLSPTAPGQLSVRDLRDVYRIQKIDMNTAVYGVMGYPVMHSLSPCVHNAWFEAAGVNAVYIPFEVHDPAAFLNRMVHPKTRELDWNLRGLSVTAPHKTAVMDHLDWIDPDAQEIGAVNTIVVDGDKLRGFNTDARSFLQPLIAKVGQARGLKCAVIGTGGAASAAAWGLTNAGAEVTVLGRNASKAAALAAKYGSKSEHLNEQSLAGFDVVVNATRLGTLGELESVSVVTTEQLRDAGLAYDLVYNPTDTQFLGAARSAGCETIGGMEMFLAQAAEQFRLWTGLDVSQDSMRAAADRALAMK